LIFFRFERFRHALLFGKLFYQPREQFLCLLVKVCKVIVQLAGGQQFRIEYLTALFADTLRVLMTVIRRPAFRLGFGSMGSIALTPSLLSALWAAYTS